MIGIYDINNSCKLNYKRRLEIYKEAGFQSVGLYLDQNYMGEEENYVDIIGYARKIGLEVIQVHIDYKIANLICDESSNDYFNYLEDKINECRKYGIKYLVTHASKGDNPPVINDLQLEKLKEVVREVNEVIICFENVRDNTNLLKILSLELDNVKMCYDLGHAHCYGSELELLSSNLNNIVCTHLHNNYGKDSHNLLMGGEINVEQILNKLLSINNIDNCLEVFPDRDILLTEKEFKQFVNKAYEEYFLLINR